MELSMTSGYVVQPSGLCLMSSVAQKLGQLPPDELHQTLVILPTQRLATYLLGELARQHTALLPPVTNSLETIIWQEARSRHSLRPARDSTVDFLLSMHLKQDHLRQLRRGQERELRLILGELYDHNVRHEAFDQLKTCLREDIYKNDSHLGSLYQRAEDIEAILQQLEVDLASRHQGIRSRIFAETVQSLAEDGLGSSIFDQGWRNIFLIGYTSLLPSWRPLIATMADRPEVTIWLAETPDLYHRRSPLQDLDQFVRQYWQPQKQLVSAANTPQARPVRILEMASPYQEVKGVVRLCEQLISQGQSPSRLAILVTDENQYHKYLRSQLRKASFNANIALSLNLRDTIVGRWIQGLWELTTKGISLTRFIGWISHPVSESWWQRQLGEELNFDHLLVFLSSQKPTTRWETLIRHAEGTPFAQSLRELSELIAPFKPKARHSLQQWFTYWNELVATFQLSEFSEAEYAEAISDAFRQLETLQDELSGTDHLELSGDEFWEFITSHVLTIEVRSIGEPLAGVQVLSLAESRFYPFDTVFLIGCNEGSFPKSLPQDELLDDYLKRSMGLPGWEALEAMEDQTFHLLKARIPQLILTRARLNGQEPQVRSRFIEKLITEGEVIIDSLDSFDPIFTQSATADAPLTFYTPETMPEYAEQCLEGMVPLTVQNLASRVSASALEKLISCPYRFLLDRLGLQDYKPFPFDDDVRLEGEWLHEVLEAFFTGEARNQAIMPPLIELTDEPDQFADHALARLEALTRHLGPHGIKETPLYYQLIHHSWPAFVEHVQRMYAGQWQQLRYGDRELTFGPRAGDYQASITVGGQSRQLMGRIDSLDRLAGFAIITDYKRQTTPERKAVEQGHSPQLSFYALAYAQSTDHEVDRMLIGYWNIIKGEWVPMAAGDEAKTHATKRQLVRRGTLDLNRIQDITSRLWHWREEHIQTEGRYYADPSACGLCPYQHVCRHKDPVIEKRIQNQNHLTIQQRGPVDVDHD